MMRAVPIDFEPLGFLVFLSVIGAMDFLGAHASRSRFSCSGSGFARIRTLGFGSLTSCGAVFIVPREVQGKAHFLRGVLENRACLSQHQFLADDSCSPDDTRSRAALVSVPSNSVELDSVE